MTLARKKFEFEKSLGKILMSYRITMSMNVLCKVKVAVDVVVEELVGLFAAAPSGEESFFIRPPSALLLSLLSVEASVFSV